MSSDELEVHGYARVAYRYQGNYYLSVDPEDFDNMEYKNVLWQLLDSIPSDPLAFATWKAARIARLQEVKELCNKDIGTDEHSLRMPDDTPKMRAAKSFEEYREMQHRVRFKRLYRHLSEVPRSRNHAPHCLGRCPLYSL